MSDTSRDGQRFSALQSYFLFLHSVNSRPRLHRPVWLGSSMRVLLRTSYITGRTKIRPRRSKFCLISSVRGLSDFLDLPYNVEMLPSLVGKRPVKGHVASHPHVSKLIKELEDRDLRNRTNNSLQRRLPSTHAPLVHQYNKDSNRAHMSIPRLEVSNMF
jgi:hypothetical protein